MEHNETDKEIIRMVVKGFNLVPARQGFGVPFTTKNGKATFALSERINKWLDETFPGSTIRTAFERNYNTINFVRRKK